MCQNDTNSAQYMRATGKEGERGKEKRTHTMGVRIKNGLMGGYAQGYTPLRTAHELMFFSVLLKATPTQTTSFGSPW